MLIDADCFRPWIVDVSFQIQLKMIVEGFVNSPRAAAKVSSNASQISEVFRGPEDGSSEAFCVAFAFHDTRNGFSEGFSASVAVEPAFAYFEPDIGGSDGIIVNGDDTMIVDGVRFLGAARADFKI